MIISALMTRTVRRDECHIFSSLHKNLTLMKIKFSIVTQRSVCVCV